VPTYPAQVRAEERAAARKRRRNRPIGIAALRVAELNREFTDRYGALVLPDDDSARDDVEIMLHHLARRTGTPRERIPQWLDSRAPWLVGEERDAMVGKVLANPLRFKADTLAARIGLTAERRTRLNIRTIGSIDSTSAERKEARRNASIERKRAARRNAGVQPRPDINNNSTNAKAPWADAGICRRTWFRRRARARGVTSTATVQAEYSTAAVR
jgi:hypothetical protein